MWLGHLIAMFAPPENCGPSSLATIGQPNDEIRMSKSELMTNDEARTQLVSSLVLRHSFVIGHFSFVIPIHFDGSPDAQHSTTPLLHQLSPIPPGSVILIGSSARSSSFSGKTSFSRAISRTVRPVLALSFAISAARS